MKSLPELLQYHLELRCRFKDDLEKLEVIESRIEQLTIMLIEYHFD